MQNKTSRPYLQKQLELINQKIETEKIIFSTMVATDYLILDLFQVEEEKFLNLEKVSKNLTKN